MKTDLLDHPIIAERYFFPRPEPFDDPYWVDCGDARLACYYSVVDHDAKTLVHFHGNGEVVADYLGDFVEIINRMGFNCFLAEYRGYGMSTGKPVLSGMLDDVETILKKIDVPAKNLVIFGRSVGSLYAVHAASVCPEAAGLVIESGIGDPLDRLLIRVDPSELGVTRAEVEEAVRLRLNQREKLASFKGSTLVMHTRHDGLLDLHHGESLHAWAPEPKRMKVFEMGDHNSILYVNAREYFHLLKEFIDSL